MNKIINGDCLEVLRNELPVDCIFADPPDNIGLKYGKYKDKMPDDLYVAWLDNCLWQFTRKADIVWISFNAKWAAAMGKISHEFLSHFDKWELKTCVQTFTFGQQSQTDLKNSHRPLWRFKRTNAPLYPDSIRVESWRLKHGDKRADPRGCLPGDVFDFPRVTGNSKQRRKWHKTQLHEGLVERCIKLSTQEGNTVLDPFGGTGTTLRVCAAIDRPCTIIEMDNTYCEHIADENNLERVKMSEFPEWSDETC